MTSLLLLCGLSVAGELPSREGVVRRGDTPYTLVGPELTVGAAAPSASLRGDGLAQVQVDFADGTIRVVTVVPSLDTATCALQTRTFNADVSDLGERVEVLVVSRDLPFAQARFCGAHGIDRVTPLSDFEAGDFGRAWGLYIQETGLLARAVYVIDDKGRVAYAQIVENVPDEPDYGAALTATRALVAD